MKIPIEWLLEGDPFIQYRTRLDIMGQSENNSEVINARSAMLLQPEIQSLIYALQDWPGKVLSSHKSASQSFHTLNFLADLGLKSEDAGMSEIITKILSYTSPEGPFRLPVNISAAHGGSGVNTGAWALCDAPNLVYALINFGLAANPQVNRAISYMTNLIQDFGWPCAVSAELGSFRGPGRKIDPCPYANLIMLKVLSLLPDWRDQPAVQTGVETLLNLWGNRKISHPYIFYMGTDFCKLKAPLIWYDILHVLDVLSRFPQAVQDTRYQEMLQIVLDKTTQVGSFIPESVYLPWKDWDFGQKKIPSRWVSLLVYRIINRSINNP
ncbi:MAG TPA: hypothetical protein VF338_06020 [Leptolinea sp.]